MSYAVYGNSKLEVRNPKPEELVGADGNSNPENQDGNSKLEVRNPNWVDGGRENSRHEVRNPNGEDGGEIPEALEPGPVRVAVLSLLFNWPTTGGGNMHTAGLVDFLGRDGFAVRHFYAQYEPWGIGRVTRDDLFASEALAFAETEWNVASIRERFRAAVDSFAPDYVVISDTWNMKPHLAEAMRGYPTILLMQAQECLCPLNNLRLLGIGPVKAEQCPRNQLATPQVCHQCLAERGQHSGRFIRLSGLAGVGSAEYDGLMPRCFTTPRPCSCSIRSQPHCSSRSPAALPSSRGGLIRRIPWPAGREGVGGDSGVNGGTEDVTAGLRDVGVAGDLRSFRRSGSGDPHSTRTHFRGAKGDSGAGFENRARLDDDTEIRDGTDIAGATRNGGPVQEHTLHGGRCW